MSSTDPRSPDRLRVVSNKRTTVCNLCHARESCMMSCLDQYDLGHPRSLIAHRSPMNRGQRLYMAGDDLQSMYVLHSGSVKSYVSSADGDSQITGFHFPGDIIGVLGIENHVHSDTVEALETSTVCEIRCSSFDEVSAAYPEFQNRLLSYVFREMSHEQEMLLVLGKMSAERRVAYFLIDISKRMASRGLAPNKIMLTMTRHDIANYLGLAVETVSRSLTRFQSHGIIHVERRVILIKHMAQLEALMGSSAGESDAVFGS